MSHPENALRWWGDFTLTRKKWTCWRIGPLTLWARPGVNEWRLAWISDPNPLIKELSIDNPAQDQPDYDECDVARFTLDEVGTGLTLKPGLADLSVVVRPETPVWIPPGQTAVLYLGTIVSIGIAPTGESQPQFIELPIFRLSDTWFGSNTRYGEFCYASKTRARTHKRLLGRVPHRAITPVEISNFGSDMLDVQQLRIPVTALNLYESESGELWTDGVRYTREHGRINAQFDIMQDATYLPPGSIRIAQPRRPIQRKTVVQAFSAIFR